tara:strand:- start:1693 stop:2619 length:927 start_codon:yes stop_codon:yes gene_type:complete
MTEKVLFITDKFEKLNLKKDTSILMIEEAYKNNLTVFQCEINDLFVNSNNVLVNCREINSLSENNDIEVKKIDLDLRDFKYCFMRKDPPVDEDYNNALHLLDLAKKNGAVIHNSPSAIKKFNEKVFATHFVEFIPKTLISSNITKIKAFFDLNKKIIIKPLDGMGGTSIYKFEELNEENLKLLKKMTNSQQTQIICQSFIEDVYEGDFRILIINGKPFPKTLARIPKDGDFKGNLAAGGKGVARDITENQKKIAETIAPVLTKNEISFAGIDIVGEYLTEINITSPTCAREILDQTNMNPIEEYFKGL